MIRLPTLLLLAALVPLAHADCDASPSALEALLGTHYTRRTEGVCANTTIADGYCCSFFDCDDAAGYGMDGTDNMCCNGTEFYYSDDNGVNRVWENRMCEISCQSDGAMSCAACEDYNPCQNSIDPRCISSAALDCLNCTFLSHCSSCSLAWDPTCLSSTRYQSDNCTGEASLTAPSGYSISINYVFDGTCNHHPVWDMYYMGGDSSTDCYSGFKIECDSTCSNCETVYSGDNASILQIDSCVIEESEESDDECEIGENNETTCTRVTTSVNRSTISEGTMCAGTNACPDGRPCGPEVTCNASTAMCATFGIFYAEDTCSNNSADFRYQTSVIADGTCRLDGSGRSWYKVACSGDMGHGLIGCRDSGCNCGCTSLSIAPNTCDIPTWANGLQLIAIGNETEMQCSQAAITITGDNPDMDCSALGGNSGSGSGDSTDSGDSTATTVTVTYGVDVVLMNGTTPLELTSAEALVLAGYVADAMNTDLGFPTGTISAEDVSYNNNTGVLQISLTGEISSTDAATLTTDLNAVTDDEIAEAIVAGNAASDSPISAVPTDLVVTTTITNVDTSPASRAAIMGALVLPLLVSSVL